MSAYAEKVKTGIIKYARDTFVESDWVNLALETESVEYVRTHQRLLKSLNWGDDDYPTHVASVIPRLLRVGEADENGELDMARVAELFPGLLAYLREADPRKYQLILENETSIPDEWVSDVKVSASPSTPSARAPLQAPSDSVSLSLATTEAQREAAEEMIVHKIEEDQASTQLTAPATPTPGTMQDISESRRAEERERSRAFSEDDSFEIEAERLLEISASRRSSGDGGQNRKRSIFIVHGLDTEFLAQVQIFVHKVTGLQPVVLKEEPNLGRTIIEKFEQVTNDSSTAIVLLTPDDEGARKGDPMRERARQNVILEWGYLIARIGRRNTIAINHGVEIPSDFQGLVYIPLDNWKESLRSNLKAAGFMIRD